MIIIRITDNEITLERNFPKLSFQIGNVTGNVNFPSLTNDPEYVNHQVTFNHEVFLNELQDPATPTALQTFWGLLTADLSQWFNQLRSKLYDVYLLANGFNVRIEDLEGAYTSLNQTVIDLNNSVSGILQSIVDINGYLDSLDTWRSDINTFVSDTNILLGSIQSDITDLQNAITDLPQALTDISTLQGQITTANQNIGTLQSDLSSLTTRVGNLELWKGTTDSTISGIQSWQTGIDSTLLGYGSRIGTLETHNTNTNTGDETRQRILNLIGNGTVIDASLISVQFDDFLEYATFSLLPVTGVQGILYYTIDTKKGYTWSGSVYVDAFPTPANTDSLSEGTTNKYFTEARVRNTFLTGLVVWVELVLPNATDDLITFCKKTLKYLSSLGSFAYRNSIAQSEITNDDSTVKDSGYATFKAANTGDETDATIKTKLGITTLSGSNTGDQNLSNLVVKNTAITGATKTKITYDGKGLVTSGEDATTADISDSTNKRYVTDTQLANIVSNPVSGTGANGRIAFWTATGTQSSDAAFLFDATGKILGVGKYKGITDSNTGTHNFYKVDGTSLLFGFGTTEIESYVNHRFRSIIYLDASFYLLNKALSSFVAFLTRDTSGSEVLANLQNVGKIALGIGLTAVSKIHSDAGNATASEMRFTAGTTTGTSASDGTIFGIGSDGKTLIKQLENLDLEIWTNNTIRAIIRASGQLVLSKDSDQGIMVDLANPTYCWRDLEGVEAPDLIGATSATLSALNGGLVRENAYTVGDKMDLRFHLPHDMVKGSDFYIHIHWTHNGTAISGNFVGTFTSCYAKGHNQASYSAEKSVTITYNTVNIATTPRLIHRIDEVALSSVGGSATLLNATDFEPDGLILMNFTMTTIPTITGGSPNEPFIQRIDIHYLSHNLGTKQKAPNFYV